MAVTFRHYDPSTLFGADYTLVRDFLLETGSTNYSFGRWDWMITHTYLNMDALSRIGLWMEDDRTVGLAVFDTVPRQGFILVREGYESLRSEMVQYAIRAIPTEGEEFHLMIRDGDLSLQQIAVEAGFMATGYKEADALYCEPDPSYVLPDGYSITTMKDTFDLRKYGEVLYKGFDREEKEGPFSPSETDIQAYHAEMLRPNVDLGLKVAVVAPNGDFVSYCGMWYDPRADFAIVEPVATDPAYRKLGLGRAAVLEAVRRCYAQGAKRAFVGSSQQFYYSIGFRPESTTTGWRKR